MSGLNQRRRDAGFAAIGLAAGLALAVLWSASHPTGRDQKAAGTLVPAVIPAAAPLVPPEELPAHQRLRSGRGTDGTKTQADWAQAAAEYAAPDGNWTRARGFLYRLDAKGLRKLAQAAAAMPAGGRRWRALRDIFQQWGRLDPEGSLAVAQALPPPVGGSAIWAAINGFSEVQPARAVAFLATPPDSGDRYALASLSSRRLMLSNALLSWSEQDGQAAARYLDGLPTNTVSSSVAGRVAEEWTRQDPASALNWALRLGDKGMRSEAVQGIVSTWAETDPQAAANRALSLSGESGQDAAVGSLVEAWAQLDPSAAARWASNQSGAVQAKSAIAVASQWAKGDPVAAAAWAGQLPVGAARDGAYANVATGWADHDPAAAQSWLNGLPLSSERDAAIAEYSGSWQNSSRPVEMVGWAERINDPQKRDDSVVTILKRWAEDQPQDARRWINQANLPDTVLSQLPKTVIGTGG